MKTTIKVTDLWNKPVPNAKIYMEPPNDTFRYGLVKDNPNTLVFTTDENGEAEIDLNGIWAFCAYGETLRSYPTFIRGGDPLTVLLIFPF